jgi:uncharacterized BrkB/YihY/UPF0761 family membrane protein
MDVNTSVPPIGGAGLPDLAGGLTSLPIQIEFSPLILLVLTMLVGIFIAAISVVLIYHWRRFPFEHEIFQTAERVYMFGVVLMLAVAVFGILIA